MNSNREQFLRDLSLKGDPVVRSRLSITYPVFAEFGERLEALRSVSPYVGVGISRQSARAANSTQTDIWGCHWIYPLESLDGICDGHPITTWPDLARYAPPNPDTFTDWKKVTENVRAAHEQGTVAWGGTDHGFIFLRSTYIRGFDTFMVDIAEDRPELYELIAKVEGFWFAVARRWIEAGVDVISFGDDLGLQHALPISPAAWRRVIKPSYQRLFQYCRSHGVHVQLHSDGYVLDIIPDLIECGVSILNVQDLVNGLDNLRRLAWGKVYLDLDVDRQNITVFGKPAAVEAHLHDCIRTLGSPNGGLSLIWGVYPGTPLANIEAAVHAMGQYATLWQEKG
jgi:uroporphyrinogen-III decarboxylase